MRNLIKSILQKTIPSNTEKPAAKQPTEQELQVATCALLLEIAHADDEFSPEEEQRVEQLMHKQFNLPQQTFNEIKEIAYKRREESIDLWQFTNIIKQKYAPEQKKQVIEMIWSVIYADRTLDKYEDYLVHKLAELLGLNHKELIDAKVKVLKATSRES